MPKHTRHVVRVETKREMNRANKDTDASKDTHFLHTPVYAEKAGPGEKAKKIGGEKNVSLSVEDAGVLGTQACA